VRQERGSGLQQKVYGQMPQVSIGLPVYNGEKYLAETLDSLLGQSFQAFEIVISDNASTDRTAEICWSYQARDSRIRYFRSEQNRGAAWNFNRAFELSSAPLFKWAACDDLHEPRFLERCVDALDNDPGVVLSHTEVKMIDEQGEALRYDRQLGTFIDRGGKPVTPLDRDHIAEALDPEVRFRDVLTHMWWCVPSFGVVRRDAFLKTARHGNYWGADKVLLAELALQGRFHQVPEQLFAKRVHDECSYGKSLDQLEEHIDSNPAPKLFYFMMFKDYIKMIATADMSIRQRIRCLLSVARLTLQPGPWRQILRRLVPQPAHSIGSLQSER
jgi:glycosyltransferase involved in cell wall biosynthesis